MATYVVIQFFKFSTVSEPKCQFFAIFASFWPIFGENNFKIATSVHRRLMYLLLQV
jgi:hypothetical protein